MIKKIKPSKNFINKKSTKDQRSKKIKENNDLEHLLRQRILNLIQASDFPLTKSQIQKAVDVRDSDRLTLKRLLSDMEGEGTLDRGQRRRFIVKNTPVPTATLMPAEIVSIDDNGDFIAEPLDWDFVTHGPVPSIRLVDLSESHLRGHSALEITSRVALRITAQEEGIWEATVVRRIVRDKVKHIGVFHPTGNGGSLSSVNRRDTFSGVRVPPRDCQGMDAGDVVQYTLEQGHHLKILKKLGKLDDPHIYSDIAIYNHNLPTEFSEEAIKIAESGKIPPLGKRKDYRHLDLVTIDGEDARDFDDAVWAAPDDNDAQNPGGWRALVAIADVSYYVRPGTALDREAFERGNSVYFPDKVVPMLPEALSNEMCSLKPNVDRACMVIEMIITAHGRLKNFKVQRGLMRSRARLTYNQVQKAIDGHFDDTTRTLSESVIKPLLGVYNALLKARNFRGTLDLEMPERQILFDDKGQVKDIVLRERYDSHKLIEELMIAANVAAAKTLQAKRWPCLYRIHDSPDNLRVASLRQFLKQYKLKMSRTDEPSPAQFNDVLHQVKDKPIERMVNELILRSQSQAKYSPDNIGHFGLSLTHYAHFTSPIRRYSDLIVHRNLIAALDLGEGGFESRPDHLTSAGEHLSKTEREAAAAEREVVDRFSIAFVAQQVGDTFDVVITGVNRSGLFVEIPATGGEGFVPKGTLGSLIIDKAKDDKKRRYGRSGGASDFYFDEANHRMVGRRSRVTYQLGDTIKAVLYEADTTTNSMTFRVLPNGSSKNNGKAKEHYREETQSLKESGKTGKKKGDKKRIPKDAPVPHKNKKRK